MEQDLKTWDSWLPRSVYRIYDRSTIVSALQMTDYIVTHLLVEEMSPETKQHMLRSIQEIRGALISSIPQSMDRTEELDETIFELTHYDPIEEEAEEDEDCD